MKNLKLMRRKNAIENFKSLAGNTTIVAGIFTIFGSIALSMLNNQFNENQAKQKLVIETATEIVKPFIDEQLDIEGNNGVQFNNWENARKLKEAAFLARQLLGHYQDNYAEVDFKHMRSALQILERRVSYAKIYEGQGKADVICENLALKVGESIQISGQLSKCKSDNIKKYFVQDIILSLVSIDVDNYRFEIEVSNDQAGQICHGKKSVCRFWVDIGDRLESTNYRFLFISEYVGSETKLKNEKGIAFFSIIVSTEKSKADSIDPASKIQDLSYFEFEPFSNNDRTSLFERVKCKPFFSQKLKNKPKYPNTKINDPFGLAILKACGPIRGGVSKTEFDELVSDLFEDQFKSVIPMFEKGLKELGVLLANENIYQKSDQIKEMLERVWFGQGAIDHVFCGQWVDGNIQGLHYSGRYEQLEFEKTACYKQSDYEEHSTRNPEIYTFGVSSTDGANVSNRKGFASNQSSLDLILYGLEAVQLCDSGATWTKYQTWLNYELILHTTKPNQKARTPNHVICKKSSDGQNIGLLTIYPDATPDRSKPSFDSKIEGVR